MKEYGSLEYGYSVMELKLALICGGKFKNVSVYNSGNIPKGQAFVPDIICTPADDEKTVYMAFDRGSLTQAAFNKRCNDMLAVTREINIVAQNKNLLIKSLRQQTRDWIKSCPPETLKDVKIHLSTIFCIRDRAHDPWIVEYDLNESLKPLRDFYGQHI